MISKNIGDITVEDLQSLIDNQVVERKTIEYKQSLTSARDRDKREFLADVSSFANASGGDLIYGITEDRTTGRPEAIEGIPIANIDQEKLRLENMIRDCIEPRIIGINIRPIELTNSNHVLIIRIPKSWISPHRVIFQSHDKFYSRNSSGKYPLDVAELRVAFNLSETITERIRKFREDRIAKIFANELPVPFESENKVVLHILPITSFTPAQSYEISKVASNTSSFKPMHCGGWNHRYNFDGFITYNGDFNANRKSSSYVQLFKNGIIEAVEGIILKYTKVPSITFEGELIISLHWYLRTLKTLNVEPPIFIFLTLLGAKGCTMSVDSMIAFGEEIHTIDRDILFLPEILIENYDIDTRVVLKPCFDSVWNACGYAKSQHYDKNGNWKGKVDL